MDDFLDKAEELHRLRPPGFDATPDVFEDVLQLISDLQAVHAKAYLDFDNIETLFGAIEMGALIGKLADRRGGAVRRLRSSIVMLIVKTLEFSVNFPVRARHICPTPPYGAFIDMLQRVDRERGTKDPHRFAFATFNYDLALDYALHHHVFPSEYCLDKAGREPASDRGPSPLLKLHGSLNWGLCPKCRQIVPLDVAKYLPPTHDHTSNVFLNFSSIFQKIIHCGDKPLRAVPVLVPPTWNKTRYHTQLRNVWHRAAVELADAENVFVIGYSLPETDSFFRYLYALGSQSATRMRRFWVFNPAEGDEVEIRFRAMVGRGVEKRFRFRRKTFTEAIKEIGDALATP